MPALQQMGFTCYVIGGWVKGPFKREGKKERERLAFVVEEIRSRKSAVNKDKFLIFEVEGISYRIYGFYQSTSIKQQYGQKQDLQLLAWFQARCVDLTACITTTLQRSSPHHLRLFHAICVNTVCTYEVD
ncbi:Uncharacterized protein TCM_021946 [Theobroma cacao]|uniref:Uncharacterized protein n=1 Tax=Theobroma cacao TaxID=3641 RepID=A0A061ES81_THECC|nr:Uncharacterized protein TCM_021946 [Theobroma cacao]